MPPKKEAASKPPLLPPGPHVVCGVDDDVTSGDVTLLVVSLEAVVPLKAGFSVVLRVGSSVPVVVSLTLAVTSVAPVEIVEAVGAYKNRENVVCDWL